MPDQPTPTHTLTTHAVRWAIDNLGAQKLHPTFVMYLYLRRESRAGALAQASASSHEVLSLIRLPGHPTKPYYFPLIDRGERSGSPLPSFWRAKNIPGSWSPGSLLRQRAGGWMSNGEGEYTLPDDHLDRAYTDLLYETQVSALALGSYFLRNDGFALSGEPSADDVIAGFRAKFDYPKDTDDEFERLYSASVPENVGFNWFEASAPTAGSASSPSDGVNDV